MEEQKKSKDLPMELLMEVLARLPVTSLVRFRSVSKTWYSIIDDSYFTSMHLSIFNNNHYYSESDKPYVFWRGSQLRQKLCSKHTRSSVNVYTDTVDAVCDCEPICVPNSIQYQYQLYDCEYKCYVDGLLLIRRDGTATGELVLLNPCIRKYLNISPILPSGESVHYPCITLLGYDASTDDYKVVLILVCLKAFLSKSKLYWLQAVYALKSGHWRVEKILDDCFKAYLELHVLDHDIIMTKGFAHWLTCDDDHHQYIVSYDFANETISCTSLPEDDDDDGSDFLEKVAFSFSFRGSVAVFCISPVCCSIRVMAKDGIIIKHWRLQWKIRRLLYVDKDHKFLIHTMGMVRSYDLDNHEIKDFLYYSSHSYSRIDPYVESLFLLSKPSGVHSQTLSQWGDQGAVPYSGIWYTLVVPYTNCSHQ